MPELRNTPGQPQTLSHLRWGSVGWALVGILILGVAIVVPTYLSVPRRNNADPSVDCLLVLGSPTEFDGKTTEAQRWRVDEAVREWKAGRAPRMLMTGGMTTPPYVEADTMAAYARMAGVPATAIFEERHALTTLENIRGSQAILDARGWHRIEVISSPEHLPRAALLLEHTDLLWQTHAAPTPGRGRVQKAGAYAEEAVGTTIMRIFGPRIEPVLHAVANVQHGIAYAIRWVFYKAKGSL